jgi:UDP-N-acetylglucosamine 2-epimerase (non-hydrolysing)
VNAPVITRTIGTLVRLLPKARGRWPVLKHRFRLDRYVLVTLHRPSNVDDLGTLTEILAGLTQISLDLPVVFPVHPRTRKRMADSGLTPESGNMQLLDPLGYLDFLAL